jgi:GNAT superfamily N-acetyltransferase
MPFYYDQGGTDRYTLQDFEPSFSGKLGAAINESWAESYGPVLRDWAKKKAASGPKLSADDAQSVIDGAGFKLNIKPADNEYSESELNVMIERQRELTIAKDVRDRTPWDFGSPVRGLAMFGAGIFDPANLVTAFVPWTKLVTGARALEAARLSSSFATRLGGRVGLGAIEGGISTAVLEPFYAGMRRSLGDDYDAVDSMANIAFGTAFGGGVVGLGGVGVDAFRKVTGRVAPSDRFRGMNVDEIQQVQTIEADIKAGRKKFDTAEEFGASDIAAAIDKKINEAPQSVRRVLGVEALEAPVMGADGRMQSPMASKIIDVDANTIAAQSDTSFISASVNGNVMSIIGSRTDEPMQGRGFGTAVYERLVNEGIDRGMKVQSGTQLSAADARKYAALEKLGFVVQRSENASEFTAQEGFPDGGISTSDGSPVFTVTRGEGYVKPVDRAIDVAERVDPETREAAFRAGTAQLVDGRVLSIDTIINSDPNSGAVANVNDIEAAAKLNQAPESSRVADFDASAKVEQENATSQKWNSLSDAEQALAEADVQLNNTIKAGDDAFKYSRAKDAPIPEGIGALGFYSALGRGVDSMTTKASTPEGWKQAIKGLVNKGLVKQDEIEWTGLNEWLDLQSGKVTKEQINEFLQNNGVKIEEVTLVAKRTYPFTTPAQWEREIAAAERMGMFEEAERINQAWEASQGLGGAGAAKYPGYTLPGNVNYRELLLRMPNKNRGATLEEIDQINKKLVENGFDDLGEEQIEVVKRGGNEAMDMLQDFIDRLDVNVSNVMQSMSSGDVSMQYRSSHWDQPNVLTHIRINDRIDVTGAKVLFVEELQSDWAQEGRKKGFLTKEAKDKQAEIDKQIEEVRAQRKIIDNKKSDIQNSDPNWMFDEKWLLLDSQSNELSTKIAELRNKAIDEGVIPVAPFIQDTKSWLSLSLKRMMNYAVENGYDKVAFINGKQSAERYDLSKQVDAIRVNLNPDGTYQLGVQPIGGRMQRQTESISADKLSEAIGKDLTKKVIDEVTEIGVEKGKVFEGIDLQVGGEGMISFYDKIVPNVTKDLLKKFGGEGMEAVSIFDQGIIGKALPEDAKPAAIRDGRLFDQPGFTITDKMRETVSGGLPLFARGAYLGTAKNLTDLVSSSFGKNTQVLLDAGQIKTVDKVSDLPGGPHPKDVKAMTAPDGTVYMVAENLSAGEVKGIVLHEVGVHVGMERMLGADAFNSVLKQLDDAVMRGESWAQAARDNVPDGTLPQHIREEQLAYLVQNSPEIGIVKQIIAAVRAWAVKNFEFARDLLTLTEADFRALAVSSLQYAARQEQIRGEISVAYARGEVPDPAIAKTELEVADANIKRVRSYSNVLRAAADKLDDDASAVAAMKSQLPDITAQEIDDLLIGLRTQVKNLRSMTRAAREAVMSGDKSDMMQTDAMQAADLLANNLEKAAVIERRNAALNIAARLKASSFVNQFRAKGLDFEGFAALLVGSQRVRTGARMSIDAEAKGYRGELVGGMLADVEKAGLLREFVSGSFDRDIYDALWRMGQDNPDMTGINSQAVKLAEVVNKYQTNARNNRNRFGAWIRDLQGYITKQSHDMYKIRAVSEDEWANFLKDRLDLPKMMRLGLISETDPMGSLRGLYDDFASGLHMKNIPAEEDSIALGRGSNLAKRESVSRTLYFKDGLSAFEYNQLYGVGTLSQSVLVGLERAASSTALLKILGTNPEVTLTRIMDEYENSLTGDRRAKFRQSRGAITNLLGQVDGSVNIPGNVNAAKVGAFLRAWQSMARLGGALISNISDLAGFAAELRYSEGKNLFSGVMDGVIALTKGRATGEQADILASLGVFHESIAGSVSARFDNPDLVGGKMAAAMQQFFKLNGLTWWTETLRDGAALQHSSYMALQSTKKFADLDPELNRLLGLYNIDEAKWDLMRMAVTQIEDGRKYLNPEALKTIPRSALEQYIASLGRTVSDTSVNNLLDDLAQTMRVMFIDRAHHAVLEPNARVRGFMLRGTKPGTVPGEIMRYIGQFKSFSIAMVQMVLGREVYGRGYDTVGEYLRNGRGDMVGLVAMVTMYGALGYIAMSIKDLIKGREPRELIDKDTNLPNPKTIAAAFAQGGGLGLYGDFLFGEYSRMGRTFTASLAGPVLGNLDTLTDLWTRLRNGDDVAAASFKALIDNTPFANLFWLRPLLDYSILFNIQESLNPGFLRRMEQRVERENSQQFIFKPSEVIR